MSLLGFGFQWAAVPFMVLCSVNGAGFSCRAILLIFIGHTSAMGSSFCVYFLQFANYLLRSKSLSLTLPSFGSGHSCSDLELNHHTFVYREHICWLESMLSVLCKHSEVAHCLHSLFQAYKKSIRLKIVWSDVGGSKFEYWFSPRNPNIRN